MAGAWTSFGLTAETGLTIRCYRRFDRSAAGFPTFIKALQQTSKSLLLPVQLKDLEALDQDTILVVAGSGELSVSGGMKVSTPVQTLAATKPLFGQQLEVNASGSMSITAKVTLIGGYQVRLRRQESNQLELGVYTLRSRAFTLTGAAEAGVSASVADFDLAEAFIAAVSLKPAVDVEEFRRALPGEDASAKEERIKGFQASLKDAISTKLAAEIHASLSLTNSKEAVWMFAIDQAAASPESTRAVTGALADDFNALTRDPAALPAGIRQIQNILTDTGLRKISLQINLLGVLNYFSLAKIAQISKIEKNERGEVSLITDSVSASHVRALLLNAAGNTTRLRQMLSEDFLITAVYHASGAGILPPEFKARQTYLEIEDSTSREDWKNHLDVACVLGLISRSDQASRLGQRDKFGRTTFYAETQYSSQMLRAVFLDADAKPRSADFYERSGRSGLGALLAGDLGQEFRQRVAELGGSGDALWRRMKELGNSNQFGPLFGLPLDNTDPRLGAVASDYAVITAWAAAMHQAAALISEIDALLSSGTVQADSPKLAQARDRLQQRLADVVGHSHEQFGDPLGLIMVYVASGEKAIKQVVATGSEIEGLALGLDSAEVRESRAAG
jgi:hypothetical protein